MDWESLLREPCNHDKTFFVPFNFKVIYYPIVFGFDYSLAFLEEKMIYINMILLLFVSYSCFFLYHNIKKNKKRSCLEDLIENNEEVVEIINKFITDNSKNILIIKNQNCSYSPLFFTFREKDDLSGLAVEILNGDKYRKKFPFREPDYICESNKRKKENGGSKKKKSSLTCIETTPNYIVYTWKDKEDPDSGSVRIETNGNEILFKIYLKYLPLSS